MLKRVFACVVLVLLLSAAASAQPVREITGDFAPSDTGERLLAVLVSLADPETLEIRMDEIPGDDGKIRNLSLFMKGAWIGGFRMERLTLESSFLELNPPREWKEGKRNSLKVRGTLRTNAEIVVLERDIQAALVPYEAEGYRLYTELKPGGVDIRVRFRIGGSGFESLAEVDAGLEIRHGSQLWLRDPRIRINRDDQTDVVIDELLKIQPFVDFAEFGIPAVFTRLAVESERLVFSTRTPPKSIDGLVYRYTRPPGKEPGSQRRETLGYSPELFRDGDIIFMNGKTWRNKVVRLFDKSPRGYSHAGVVRMVDGIPHVIHASPDLGRVGMQCMDEFLAAERVDYAKVYRMKDAPDKAEAASLKALEFTERDIPFDDRFDISRREAMYCTELIWLAYKSAGVDLAEGKWEYARNPIVQGRVLLPYKLSLSPHLSEVFTLE